MESFNRSFYADTALTPRLNEITNKFDFSHFTQTPGAGITIEGLMASLCGVPYSFDFTDITGGIDDKAKNTFPTQIKCAPAVLKDLGFYLYYLGGARLEYQNNRGLFKTLGFDEAWGQDELKQAKNIQNLGAWGVYDDELFGIAYDDFIRLSKQNRPFLMSVMTTSTHVPDGALSPYCQKLSGSSDYEKAIKCTDIVISDFIQKIKSSTYATNTIIALISDHTMPSGFAPKEIDEKYDSGYLLFHLIDSDIAENKQIALKGTSLDSFATILGYMSISNELNLGRNVFKQKSLKEQNFGELDYSTAAIISKKLEYK